MLELAIMLEGQAGLNWPRWQRMALAVEDLGFAGLYRSDHFTISPPDEDSLDLWVSLTWLASHTQRIEFGPLVSPVSFRDPVLTARMGLQVDDLSGGRLTLGVGAGWNVREHAMFGYDLLDVPDRLDRFEEGLEVITRLLNSDTPVSFSGKYYRLQDAILLPRPERPGGPPILIGGNGMQRTLPLVARYAREWNGVFITAGEYAQRNTRLDELLQAEGPPARRRAPLLDDRDRLRAGRGRIPACAGQPCGIRPGRARGRAWHAEPGRGPAWPPGRSPRPACDAAMDGAGRPGSSGSLRADGPASGLAVQGFRRALTQATGQCSPRHNASGGKNMDHHRETGIGEIGFFMLTVAAGIVAGLGAVLFRALIGFIHNLLFLGQLSFTYDANVHTPPSVWGPLVILVPVVGAIGVSYLVKNFAPEAKGHGVPEVIDAIYYNRGIIRPIVAAVKSLASGLSIGSGGSVGREGPIIQIGASFGSSIGQILKLPEWQVITLIAAGAGGGIAATFNTPVGGILFAIELILVEVSMRTLVPVAIATAIASYIGRVALGGYPSFVIPELQTLDFHPIDPWALLAFLGLGCVVGLVSMVFIRVIYGAEDFFDKRIGGSYYRKHLLGMLIIGLLLYGLMAAFGHYYIEGVGYATVQDTLSGVFVNPSDVAFLLLLLVLKLLATAITLGSGASGGVFSPSLFIGATLGAAYAIVLHAIFPALALSVPAFAVVGMASMVGSATGAALTAVVMIFEMTLDYSVIIPLILAVATSYGIRRLLSKDSIYTLKLVRRGHRIPRSLQTNLLYTKPASQVMSTRFKVASAATPCSAIAPMVPEWGDAPVMLLAETEGKIIGYLPESFDPRNLSPAIAATPLGEHAEMSYITVSKDTSVLEVMDVLRTAKATVALVTENQETSTPGNVEGFLTRGILGSELIENTQFFD